jgi:hypothetical protein
MAADCLQRLIPSSLKEIYKAQAVLAALEVNLIDIACRISDEPFDITQENVQQNDIFDLCFAKEDLRLLTKLAIEFPSSQFLERLVSL